MFCKFCGDKIKPTDMVCPSCGRETLPMSDCGGFYNLKLSGGTSPVPAQELIAGPQCPIIEKMEPKYARDRKAAKVHHTTTVACFSAVLVALILCVVLIINLCNKLDDVTEMILCISQNHSPNPTEDDLDVFSEHTETTEKMAYIIELGVNINDEKTEIGTVSDFGAYAMPGEVVTKCIKDAKSGNFSIFWEISEKEEYINLDIAYGMNNSIETMGVQCETNVVLFETPTFDYSWQYLDENDNWIEIGKNLVTVKDGYCSIACTDSFLNSVFFQEGLAKLRSIINITNENGDTIAVTVDGFTVFLDLPLG